MNTLIPGEKLSPIGQQIEWFIKHVGLDSKDATIHEHSIADANLRFSLVFTVPISFHHSPGEIVDSYISKLREQVRNSEEVSRMVMDVVKEKNDLKEQVKTLKAEIQSLQPLKHHYDVEMNLRHGEIKNDIKRS